MGYVLFSPLGKSDPIRGYRDGAWLHICRVYQPRVCRVYLTAELCRLEKHIEADGHAKDLYARTMALLNQHLYAGAAERYIHLQFERDPRCEDAHSLEYFIQRFQPLLYDLHSAYPDDEMLINVSSGTPGMKSALMALSIVLPFKATVIQVSDPANGLGEKYEVVDSKYDVQAEWDCNDDNDAKRFVNRTSVQPLKNLSLKMRVNELCRLVREGDYHTALKEAQSESLKSHIPPKAFAALSGAEQRSCLATEKAVKSLKTSGFHLDQRYGLRVNQRAWECAEYLLTMENDMKSGAFDNFMRKLTPLLVNLCELYLAKMGKDVRRNGVNADGKWERNRMPDEWVAVLESEFYAAFKDGTYLASANLIPLIRKYGDAPRAAELAGMLREAENNARNIVAHQIVPFGRSEIESALQAKAWYKIRTPEALAACLREFLELIQPFHPEYWHSYDAMNDHICALLKSAV